MTEFFDVVYRNREVSAPVDYGRGFYGSDTCGLDAPACIPAGSTESIDGHSGEFHCTSYHFRAGF